MNGMAKGLEDEQSRGQHGGSWSKNERVGVVEVNICL